MADSEKEELQNANADRRLHCVEDSERAGSQWEILAEESNKEVTEMIEEGEEKIENPTDFSESRGGIVAPYESGIDENEDGGENKESRGTIECSASECSRVSDNFPDILSNESKQNTRVKLYDPSITLNES